jgi:preprotein translocase subunit SecE
MMKKFIQYLRDVRTEMSKVSWPTRNEVAGATTLVVVLSLIVSAFVKVFDLILSNILGLIINT